jgi:cytochrome c biogenesis protein CcmG/thiol:disulfide interchange protein DsbE
MIEETNVESREGLQPAEDEPQDKAQPPKSRRGRTAIVLGLVVVFVVGLMGILLIKPPQRSLCDEVAPALSLPLFDQYRGGWPSDTLNLADLKGKGVVVNFWASWCQPCEQEAQALETAAQQFKDKGIVFVGVDYLDQEPSAKAYLQKFGVSYPNGPDLAGKISQRYAIRGVPETFFINPDGKIVSCRKVGPLEPAELQQRIAEIMPRQ